MIHVATVLLTITYDDQGDDGFMVPRAEPADWNWHALLDLGFSEDVAVWTVTPARKEDR